MKEQPKCEICGKKIEGNFSFYRMFGRKACSEECMIKLSEKENKAMAEKLSVKK